MATLLDEISPDYYGEDRIRLALANANELLQVFRLISVTVDVSRCLPQGVMLPLEFTVSSPSQVRAQRVVFKRFVPPVLSFKPVEGGTHLLRVSELFHNGWWGSLVLDISGDRLRAQP